MASGTFRIVEVVNFDSFLDIVNPARKGFYIGRAYTLRDIRKTHEEVHMGYNNGNNPT
jgi:hypothetical protein